MKQAEKKKKKTKSKSIDYFLKNVYNIENKYCEEKEKI